MASQDEYISEFINRMYGAEREQPIERLIISLDSLPIILNIPIKSNYIMQEVKRKMQNHRKVRVTKKIMKRLIEVIIDSAKTNRVNICDIENTFKEPPHYGLETNDTIILPEALDETQYEFKSILEDVTEGVHNLAEKTQSSLDIKIGVTDRFIQQKKNGKLRRIDEMMEEKEIQNILPKRDVLYNWNTELDQKSNRADDKCNEILSRINNIIEKSEGTGKSPTIHREAMHEERSDFSNEQIKRLETYETRFNEKMLSLLTELSDKIAKPVPMGIADLNELACKKELNISEDALLGKEDRELGAKPALWQELAKYGGAGMLSGICIGVLLMYNMTCFTMPY